MFDFLLVMNLRYLQLEALLKQKTPFDNSNQGCWCLILVITLNSMPVVICHLEVKDLAWLSTSELGTRAEKMGIENRSFPPITEDLCPNTYVQTCLNKNTEETLEHPALTASLTKHLSVPSFTEKLIWKVLSPAFHSSDCFLPWASTLSPPRQWFLLGRFIHNSITFVEGSARGMVRSRCSRGPRLGPEECIFLPHSHTGNWSNFQSRLCFTTAHQVNIEMIYTIYHILGNTFFWTVHTHLMHLTTSQGFWKIFKFNAKRQCTLTGTVGSLAFKQ